MTKEKINSKDKILKAALKLFTQKGIKSTTTKLLAKKAGVAEGTLYNHFKSKKEIAHYLFKHYMNLFTKCLSENSRDIIEPDKKITALIKAFFDFANKEPKAIYYIVIAHYTELDILKNETFKLRNIFAEAIEDGVRKRRFTKIDKYLGAALIIGMINRAVLSYNNGFIDMEYSKIITDTNKAAIKLLSR